MTQLLRTEQVDSLTNVQLDHHIYECIRSLFPIIKEFPEWDAVLYSWPKHEWFYIEDRENIMAFVFPSYAYKRNLPHFTTCAGVSIHENGSGQFKAEINTAYYPDALTSYSDSEDYAFAKVWLKAFIKGWVDRNYAAKQSQLAHHSVSFIFRGTGTSAATLETHRHTYKAAFEVGFQSQSVTSKAPELKTVTSVQTVTVDIVSFETVTPIQSVTSDTKFCLCGCGSLCSGRQKLASVACRKRYSRARNAA